MVSAGSIGAGAESPATPPDLVARAVQQLRAFVAIPSVSTRGEFLAEGAAHTAALLEGAGLRVETWSDDGAPVVFAERPGPAGAPTVLFYGHYDVQPPEPIEAWTSPPFAAEVRDGAVFGRGAGDNKGQLLAHIEAIRTLIAARRLDVGVKFLVEGEEEIGSPRIAGHVERHRAALMADLALTSDAPLPAPGQPSVIFGVRGLLYLEIEILGARSDVHSGNRGGIAPAPAWKLVHLLARLRDADGRVQVPGFYEPVRAPTTAEQAMLATVPLDAQRIANDLGATLEADPDRLAETLMFRPTFNLAGIGSGYQGPGTKTIVPHRAACKLDIRLVADQDPTDVVGAIRASVARLEPDATVRLLASVPPSATPVDTPLAAPVTAAVKAAYGRAPILAPRLAGTTPDYIFTRGLGIPSLLVPYGPPDMNHHAPDERMTLWALERGIRCTTAICRILGARQGPTRPDEQ